MLKRKQIQLTARQAQAVHREAVRQGVSDAAVIRGLIDGLLPGNERATNERWERALAAVGRFRSGLTDIGRNHDRYLAEDFDD